MWRVNTLTPRRQFEWDVDKIYNILMEITATTTDTLRRTSTHSQAYRETYSDRWLMAYEHPYERDYGRSLTATSTIITRARRTHVGNK